MFGDGSSICNEAPIACWWPFSAFISEHISIRHRLIVRPLTLQMVQRADMVLAIIFIFKTIFVDIGF
jgi:hypothetical protein